MEQFNIAYTAFIGHKLVGFIATWTTNKFHPFCNNLLILSEPDFDVEGKLLVKLKEELDHLPLQTAIWETTTHLKNFCEDNDFHEIRRTYMPRLNVTDAAMPHDHNGWKVKTLTEILAYEPLMEKLTQLVKYNYEIAHKVNPVADMESKQWKELMLADDMVPDGSYLFVNEMETEIIAYSFMHTSDEKDTLELGWCGVNHSYNKKLLPSLVYQQIIYCKKNGMPFLAGEFDTTDNYAMEVYTSFPFEPCSAWITYQK